MNPRQPRLSSLGKLAAIVLLAGCSLNPATRKIQVGQMSEVDEMALGWELHHAVVDSVGLVEEADLVSYIGDVGRRIAAVGERRGVTWTFAVLDDPSVTAFAIPGGFVYVSRGLLAYLDNEAELAAVLAHEIAHVHARHGAEQYARAQRIQRGVGLLRIFDPKLQYAGAYAIGAARLRLLKHSREHELEADDLALRYLDRSAYPTGALAGALNLLKDAAEEEDTSGQLPTWLSTHPDPSLRLQRLSHQEVDRGTPDQRGRGRYLPRLNGLVVGQDPRRGILHEEVFYWPSKNMKLAIPFDWKASISRDQFVVTSQDDDAACIVKATRVDNPRKVEEQVFGDESVEIIEQREATVASLPARIKDFRVTINREAFEGLFVSVDHPEGVIFMLAMGPEPAWSRHTTLVRDMIASVSTIEDPNLLNAKPAQISIVRLEAAQSLRTLMQSKPTSIPAETLEAINRVELDTQLPAGSVLKWVNGGFSLETDPVPPRGEHTSVENKAPPLGGRSFGRIPASQPKRSTTAS